METQPVATPPFAAHFEETLQGLRASLTEILASIGADPGQPYRMAGELGLNKNLAWKVAKIVNAPSGCEAVQHVPGPGGIKILFETFAQHGAGERELAALREALDAFDRMVEIHSGDRATLELMLGSMSPDRVDPQRLESNRKLSFRGNGATWGVQARVRVGVQFVAPSLDHPGEVDVGTVAGFVDFRRLRPTAWPLLMNFGYSEDGREEPSVQPLAGDASEPPLLREFCTSPLPELRTLPRPDGRTYELREGPVGHAAASTCIFGWVARSVGSAYRDGDDHEVAELMVHLNTPVEILVHDFLVHRDLPFEGAPSLHLYSLMHGPLPFPLWKQEHHRIPCAETLQDLGQGPPVLATPHVPRHRELVQTACEGAGWNLADFRGYRLVMRYPPIPTMPVLSYPLTKRIR